MADNQITYYGTENAVSVKNGIVSSTAGVGAKNGSTVSVYEEGDGIIHKTVLTCTATPISVADEAGAGQYGGTKVYDFPKGSILTLGATIDGAVTVSSGTIVATFDGDIGLGEAAPTDHAGGVSGTILQATATTTAVASVETGDAQSIASDLTESPARTLDGTSTAKDLYLNLLIDDDASHTAAVLTFTGTITIIWAMMGLES